jgi:glutathione S-transferase
MEPFVLYDAANSPCGRRVRMTLLEKGQPFEIRWMNLALMDQKQPWYLRLNPNGLVPTLAHGDRVVYESSVINQYVESQVPTPALMPTDPYEVAQVQMWMAFELDWAKPFRDAIYETFAKDRLKANVESVESLAAEIGKRRANPVYTEIAKKVLTQPRNDALVHEKLAILFEKMDWMDDKLSDGREWLVGNRFSLADIALGPRTDMFDKIGVADFYDRYPHIKGFMDRLKARPSWEASQIMPETGQPVTQVAA